LNGVVGEPFVPDSWIEKAEYTLRQKYPQIPETIRFATYVQPRTWTKLNGLDREIPDTAVFLVSYPSPKDDPAHKNIVIYERGAELLSLWRQREKFYKRNPSQVDPLVAHFEAVLRSAADRHKNLRTMLS
jgi:hypothetical protein